MALFDWFGKKSFSQKKIDQVAALAANPFAQPDVRMREMQRLLDDGSEAALRGLLKRFKANAHGHIADEDEKKWLEDALVEAGTMALGPLRHFISTEERLTYALKAYERLVAREEAAAFFLQALEHHGADNHRMVEAKLQLALQLEAYGDVPGVLAGLCPFLHDHSDDVRWAVMDIFDRAKTQGTLPEVTQAQVCLLLEKTLADKDTSPRILGRSTEILKKFSLTAS